MDVRAMQKTVRGFFNVREGRARHKVIRKRVIEGATIDGIHVCQLIAAMIIASIGLNVNSTEAVIGAMLICPLMGSVLAIAYAIASVDFRWLRDATIGLLVQVLVCLVTSTIYFLISPLSNATSELLTNSSATIWDVFIAFVGGFAGALGSSRRQTPSTLVAGVAVATALMPPLCSTGYGLAMRDYALSASAFYEFVINVVFISFGAEIVLILLRTPLHSDINGDGVVTEDELELTEYRSRALRKQILIGSIVLALPCLFFTGRFVRESMADNGTLFEVYDTYDTEFTTYELRVLCPDVVSYRIGRLDSFDIEERQIMQRVVATVETSKETDEKLQGQMEQIIRLHVGEVDEVTFEVSSP